MPSSIRPRRSLAHLPIGLTLLGHWQTLHCLSGGVGDLNPEVKTWLEQEIGPYGETWVASITSSRNDPRAPNATLRLDLRLQTEAQAIHYKMAWG